MFILFTKCRFSLRPSVFAAVLSLALCAAPGLCGQELQSWKLTANMGIGRSDFELIKIDAHRVLIMGGWADDDLTPLLQEYDARTKQVRQRTAMPLPTGGFASATLHDGVIIVTGGTHGGGWPHVSVSFYDPARDTWTRSSNLRAARSGHRSVVWDERTILVVGGGDSGMEFYDVVDREARDAPYSQNGTNGALVRIAKDSLIAFGWRLSNPIGWPVPSRGDTSVQLLLPIDRPASGPFRGMTAPIYWPSVVQMTSGNTLIAGGVLADSAAVNTISTEIQMFKNLSFSRLGNLLVPRARPLSVEYANGKVLVVGGMDKNSLSLASTEVIDVATGNVAMGPTMNEARNGFGVTTLIDADGNTVVVAVGGRNATGRLGSIEELLVTPNTNTGINGSPEDNATAPSLVLSPNPTFADVTVRVSPATQSDATVLVVDSQGRVVHTSMLRSGQDNTLLTGLDAVPIGLYTVVLQGIKETHTTQLVIVR